MNKKHILIIEDIRTQAEDIKNALVKNLSNGCKIFPESFNEKDERKELIIQDFLLEQVIEENFKYILDFYDRIDIFIIDVYLIGYEKIGETFANYILNNKKGSFNIILISNNPLESSIFSNKKVKWLQKTRDIDEFPNHLAQMVSEIISQDFNE